MRFNPIKRLIARKDKPPPPPDPPPSPSISHESLSSGQSGVESASPSTSSRSQWSVNTEGRYKLAKQWVKEGVGRTVAAGARKFGLKYQTFYRRVNGLNKSATEAHADHQLLTPVHEDVLADWCDHESNRGTPLDQRSIKPRVKDLTGRAPGKNWFRRFLGRHPTVALRRPSGLDPSRAQAFNWPVVQRHFDVYRTDILDRGIPRQNIYNMDEKGIQLGGGRKNRRQKFFVPRNKRPKYAIRSENLELVTVIDCISQDGTGVKPSFIFSGKEIDGRWYDEGLSERIGSVGTSPNGWTDDFLCLQWFEKVFLPHATAHNSSGLPIVLIFDGHGSHTALEMAELAAANNCILYQLPPHTTHYLQPLDVDFFGPIQTRWAQRCDELAQDAVIRGEKGMTRANVIPEYLDIRDAVLRDTDSVAAAWRKCGLEPFNPLVFGESEAAAAYAPSSISSTRAHLPSSYPFVDFSSPPLALPAPSPLSSDSLSDLESTEPETEPEPRAATTALITRPSIQVTLSDRELSQRSRGDLLIDYSHLQSDLDKERRELQTARSHAIMMAFENARLKAALNKPKDSGRIPLTVDARILTGDEGIALLRAQRAARTEAQRVNDERAAAKKAAEQRRIQDRQLNAATRILKGPVTKSRKKDDLIEIAYSLSITECAEPSEADELRDMGTVAQLIERIQAFLARHPDLKNDDRFVRLFLTERQAAKRPAEDLADTEDQHRIVRPRIALTDISTTTTAPGPEIPQPMVWSAYTLSAPPAHHPNSFFNTTPTHLDYGLPPHFGNGRETYDLEGVEGMGSSGPGPSSA